jgi:hypothetical protein
MKLVLLVVLALGLPITARANTTLTPMDSTAMDWSRVPEYRIVPGDVLMLDFGHRAGRLGRYAELQRASRRPHRRCSRPAMSSPRVSRRWNCSANIVALLSGGSEDAARGRRCRDAGRQRWSTSWVASREPGSFPAGPFVTVMQANRGGGRPLRMTPSRNSVLLFHRDGAHTVAVSRVRLDRLMKGDDLADAVVGRFDIIYVPRSTIGNINVFAQQFLAPAGTRSCTSSLVGWELFNLDRSS